MIRFLWFFLLISPAAAQSVSRQSSVVDLPRPTGPFAVGRVSYDWVDPARLEVLSKVPNTSREIMVYIWYPAGPAKPGAITAPYFPDAEKIDKGPFAQGERAKFGKSWPLIVSGKVHTHAYENALVAPGEVRFPLLIFSHGYGWEPFAFTDQIEGLVSRGYVVATITHTYEVTVTTFPDGRMIPFSEENSPESHFQSPSEEKKWEMPRIDVWAGDIRFALDQITRLNRVPDRQAPWSGRVDLGRVGVFGESFGGAAAARACELDQRFKACLNQDGLLADGPIVRYEGGHMPTQPYLYLRGLPTPDVKTDSKEFKEFNGMIDKELQECTRSIQIRARAFDHRTFADVAVLLAAGNRRETAKALESLQVIESYTAAFFDQFLNGARDTLLDREPAKDSGIQIKRYPR